MEIYDEIKKRYDMNPEFSRKQAADEIGCDIRTIYRNIEKIKKDYDIADNAVEGIAPVTPQQQEMDAKLSKMMGHRCKVIPVEIRRIIARIVYETEIALNRQPIINLEKSTSEKESANLIISDLHAGKETFDDHGFRVYGKDICAFRMALLKERVIKLLSKHLRPNTIDEFMIYIIGDIVDGSGIYPGQEQHQDLTWVTDQIVLALAGIWNLIAGIRKVLKVPVKIKAVPGNHGRQSKEAPLQNNFDYMVYQHLYMMAEYEDPKGVEVEYSVTAPYLNFIVKNHKVHIRHQAPPQTETAAAKAKFGGWQSIHDWDVFCYAHLHHPGNPTHQAHEVFMNGSPVGMDDLSESMAVYSRPSQWLFGIDPDKGVSFRYNVYLDQFGDGGEADELLNKYPKLRNMKGVN
jgi:hypothetical protein